MEFATYFADDVRLDYYCRFQITTSNLDFIFPVNVIAGNIIDLQKDNSLVLPLMMQKLDDSTNPRRIYTLSGIHITCYKIYMLYTKRTKVFVHVPTVTHCRNMHATQVFI